jgi:hypothetical protein
LKCGVIQLRTVINHTLLVPSPTILPFQVAAAQNICVIIDQSHYSWRAARLHLTGGAQGLPVVSDALQ